MGRFGINIVDDKAAFFGEWHIHYTHWGGNYGRNLASAEDSDIIEKIASYCKKVKETDFSKILEKFRSLSDIVIFATNVSLYRFFEKSKNFKPKWYKDSPQLKLRGFRGWYILKGQYIPVFEIYHRRVDKQIMVLNKSKLGKLIQYSPLNEGDKEELRKGTFYLNVQAFSENEELMKKFLEKPPKWLQEFGDENKQREYLKERVLIHIFERFEFNKSEEFEGYLYEGTYMK